MYSLKKLKAIHKAESITPSYHNIKYAIVDNILYSTSHALKQ